MQIKDKREKMNNKIITVCLKKLKINYNGRRYDDLKKKSNAERPRFIINEIIVNWIRMVRNQLGV